MAKYTGPDCRLCRREGAKLYLKGSKCNSEKCAMNRRATVPGQHGSGRKKQSDYSIQLREKQKTKRIYGVSEKQFRHYYDKAEKMRGVTGTNMLILLERRLDNVVYRMKLGVSRSQARQIVNHGLISVNGQTVNIPSYLIKVGDVIAVKANKTDRKLFEGIKDEKTWPLDVKWMTFTPATLSGQITEFPTREDIDPSIAEHMIVELYSK